MRRVFIADAHLRRPEDKNYITLLSFLSDIQDSVDSLFILGDLFEFWIGYDDEAFPHYRPVLDLLKRLSDKGVEIVYFEGNHDFHLGPFFQNTLRAQIFTGPSVLTLDGKRVYLCHGDQVNSNDIGYRILRLVLHNPVTKSLIRLFPSALVFKIASFLSHCSRNNHNSRNLKYNYELIVRNFANERCKEGCDVVITAHFHLPFLSSADTQKECILLSLGDWITQFTYGEIIDGKVSLRHYQP